MANVDSDISKPQEPPELWPVTLQFNAKAWHNTLDEKIAEQFKSGAFRVLWFGEEPKHGIAALILKNDTAPHGDDTYHVLLHLSRMLEEAVKYLSSRGKITGHL